jgi:hypothetical protein
VLGGVRLCDGTQLSVVTGIDDHSRYCEIAKLVARATAKPCAMRSSRGCPATRRRRRSSHSTAGVFTGRLAYGLFLKWTAFCARFPHTPSATPRTVFFRRSLWPCFVSSPSWIHRFVPLQSRNEVPQLGRAVEAPDEVALSNAREHVIQLNRKHFQYRRV